MELDIVRKLRAELQRGISTEAQVVYLMVKLRKLLDLDADQGKSSEYGTLRLCCDWTVHVALSGARAQRMIKMADAAYPKLLRGELTDQDKDEFRNVFSLARFQEELNQFLAEHHLPTISGAQWNSFLACFLNTIEDCPLRCEGKGTNTTEVDEIVLIKEMEATDRAADGKPPQILWALCFQGNLKCTMGANFTLSDKVVDALVDPGRRRGPQTSGAVA